MRVSQKQPKQMVRMLRYIGFRETRQFRKAQTKRGRMKNPSKSARCRGPESNWRHMVLQTIALPTELPRRAPSTATAGPDDEAIERLLENGGSQERRVRCSGYQGRGVLDLALHLHIGAREAHHELERLAAGVADAVEAFGRRHHAERARPNGIRLVPNTHLAFTLQNEEAFLDVAIADLVSVHRDLLPWIDLRGTECQLRGSLRRVEEDGATNSGDDVAEGLVGAVGYSHPAKNRSAAATPTPSSIG